MPNPQTPVAKNPDIEAKEQADTDAKQTPREMRKKNKAKSIVSSKNAQPLSPTEFMATEYKGISIYAMTMAVLIGLILWTGVATVQQIQAYHQQYSNLQQLKKDYRQLQIENQRLLIEQQTFSATPQIASRAVSELNMFYPQLSDRMIIQASNLTTIPEKTTSSTAQQNASSHTATATASPNPVINTTTNAPTISEPTVHTNQIENARVTPIHPVIKDPDELKLPQANSAIRGEAP